MKPLLCCLLMTSFVFPAWSQEKEMTLDEFIEKVGNAKPWTLEKLEAELDIKFEFFFNEIVTRMKSSPSRANTVATVPLVAVKRVDNAEVHVQRLAACSDHWRQRSSHIHALRSVERPCSWLALQMIF